MCLCDNTSVKEQEIKKMACKETTGQAENGSQRSALINVCGVPMAQHIAKNLNATLAFRPDPSDLLISSYPKSGEWS